MGQYGRPPQALAGLLVLFTHIGSMAIASPTDDWFGLNL